MITTGKLMSAAFAVAAVATLSLGAGGDAQARGGNSGGGMRASFSGKFSGGQGMVRRAEGHRFHRFGFAYNTCWKWTPAGLVNVCRVLPY